MSPVIQLIKGCANLISQTINTIHPKSPKEEHQIFQATHSFIGFYDQSP
jgi:hypothetical protein